MRKGSVLMVMVAAMLLSGCGIYGKYHRPEEIKTEGLFRFPNDEATSADTTTLATIPWREFFADTLLLDLIERGLEVNASIRVAELSLEQARAHSKAAGLAFLPSISVAPSVGVGYSELGGFGKVTYQVPYTATWQLDLFGGQIINSKRQADAQKRMAEARLHSVQTDIVAAIANYYYRLMMLDAQDKVATRMVKIWEANLEMTKPLVKEGQLHEVAVERMKGQAFGILNTAMGIRRQMREVENALSILLHQPPQAFKRSELTNQKPLPIPAIGVPVQLLAHRPDVRIAEQAVEVAFYGTNRARGAFLPGVTISSNGAWTNSVGAAIVEPGVFIAKAVASLFQPIFNQGKNIAQLKIAKAEQEKATILLQETLLKAGVEVSNLLNLYYAMELKIEARTSQVKSLERATWITIDLLREGEANYLELLTARAEFLEARLAQIEEYYQQNVIRINLYKALGGGSSQHDNKQ